MQMSVRLVPELDYLLLSVRIGSVDLGKRSQIKCVGGHNTWYRDAS